MPGTAATDDELLIYPSRQKYSESRRLPFLAYQDRLRRLLSQGETLLVILGYSFSDQHINEILFQGLRTNNRLAAVAIMFDELSSAAVQRNLVAPSEGLRNLTIYGPDAAVIGNVRGNWTAPTSKAPATLGEWPFWDAAKSKFTLGDFNAFAQFLQRFMGARVSSDVEKAS